MSYILNIDKSFKVSLIQNSLVLLEHDFKDSNNSFRITKKIEGFALDIIISSNGYVEVKELNCVQNIKISTVNDVVIHKATLEGSLKVTAKKIQVIKSIFSNGKISLKSDCEIDCKSLYGARSVKLKSTAIIRSRKSLGTAGKIQIKSKQYFNSQCCTFGEDVQIDANEIFNEQGIIRSLRALNIQAIMGLHNAKGRIEGDESHITVSYQRDSQLTWDDRLQQTETNSEQSLSQGLLDNTDGIIKGNGSLKVVASGAITTVGGKITGKKSLQVESYLVLCVGKGSVVKSGDTLNFSCLGPILIEDGAIIFGKGETNISSTRSKIKAGKSSIGSGKKLNVSAYKEIESKAEINAWGALKVISTTTTINQEEGQFHSDDRLEIHANEKLTLLGCNTAIGCIEIGSKENIINKGGKIFSDKKITICSENGALWNTQLGEIIAPEVVLKSKDIIHHLGNSKISAKNGSISITAFAFNTNSDIDARTINFELGYDLNKHFADLIAQSGNNPYSIKPPLEKLPLRQASNETKAALRELFDPVLSKQTELNKLFVELDSGNEPVQEELKIKIQIILAPLLDTIETTYIRELVAPLLEVHEQHNFSEDELESIREELSGILSSFFKIPLMRNDTNKQEKPPLTHEELEKRDLYEKESKEGTFVATGGTIFATESIGLLGLGEANVSNGAKLLSLGEIVVLVPGRIFVEYGGIISSDQNSRITSKYSIVFSRNDSHIKSTGTCIIRAKIIEVFSNSSIEGEKDLNLIAEDLLMAYKTARLISQSGSVYIKTPEVICDNESQIYASEEIVFSNDLSSICNTDSVIESLRGIYLPSCSVENKGGQIRTEGKISIDGDASLEITGGVLYGKKKIKISIFEEISIENHAEVVSKGKVSIVTMNNLSVKDNSSIRSGDSAVISTEYIFCDDSMIEAVNTLDLGSIQIHSSNSKIRSTNGKIHSTGVLIQENSYLHAAAGLEVDSHVKNENSVIESFGPIHFPKVLIENSGGTIQTKDSLTFEGPNTFGRMGGKIFADKSITLLVGHDYELSEISKVDIRCTELFIKTSSQVVHSSPFCAPFSLHVEGASLFVQESLESKGHIDLRFSEKIIQNEQASFIRAAEGLDLHTPCYKIIRGRVAVVGPCVLDVEETEIGRARGVKARASSDGYQRRNLTNINVLGMDFVRHLTEHSNLYPNMWSDHGRLDGTFEKPLSSLTPRDESMDNALFIDGPLCLPKGKFFKLNGGKLVVVGSTTMTLSDGFTNFAGNVFITEDSTLNGSFFANCFSTGDEYASPIPAQFNVLGKLTLNISEGSNISGYLSAAEGVFINGCDLSLGSSIFKTMTFPSASDVLLKGSEHVQTLGRIDYPIATISSATCVMATMGQTIVNMGVIHSKDIALNATRDVLNAFVPGVLWDQESRYELTKDRKPLSERISLIDELKLETMPSVFKLSTNDQDAFVIMPIAPTRFGDALPYMTVLHTSPYTNKLKPMMSPLQETMLIVKWLQDNYHTSFIPGTETNQLKTLRENAQKLEGKSETSSEEALTIYEPAVFGGQLGLSPVLWAPHALFQSEIVTRQGGIFAGALASKTTSFISTSRIEVQNFELDAQHLMVRSYEPNVRSVVDVHVFKTQSLLSLSVIGADLVIRDRIEGDLSATTMLVKPLIVELESKVPEIHPGLVYFGSETNLKLAELDVQGSEVIGKESLSIETIQRINTVAQRAVYHEEETRLIGWFSKVKIGRRVAIVQRAAIRSLQGSLRLKSPTITGSGSTFSAGLDVVLEGPGTVLEGSVFENPYEISSRDFKFLSMDSCKISGNSTHVEPFRVITGGDFVVDGEGGSYVERGLLAEIGGEVRFLHLSEITSLGLDIINHRRETGSSIGLSFFGSDIIGAIVDNSALHIPKAITQDPLVNRVKNLILSDDIQDAVAEGTYAAINAYDTFKALESGTVAQVAGQRFGLLDGNGSFNPSITLSATSYSINSTEKRVLSTHYESGGSINRHAEKVQTIEDGFSAKSGGDIKLTAGEKLIATPASEETHSSSEDISAHLSFTVAPFMITGGGVQASHSKSTYSHHRIGKLESAGVVHLSAPVIDASIDIQAIKDTIIEATYRRLWSPPEDSREHHASGFSVSGSSTGFNASYYEATQSSQASFGIGYNSNSSVPTTLEVDIHSSDSHFRLVLPGLARRERDRPMIIELPDHQGSQETALLEEVVEDPSEEIVVESKASKTKSDIQEQTLPLENSKNQVIEPLSKFQIPIEHKDLFKLFFRTLQFHALSFGSANLQASRGYVGDLIDPVSGMSMKSQALLSLYTLRVSRAVLDLMNEGWERTINDLRQAPLLGPILRTIKHAAVDVIQSATVREIAKACIPDVLKSFFREDLPKFVYKVENSIGNSYEHNYGIPKDMVIDGVRDAENLALAYGFGKLFGLAGRILPKSKLPKIPTDSRPVLQGPIIDLVLEGQTYVAPWDRIKLLPSSQRLLESPPIARLLNPPKGLARESIHFNLESYALWQRDNLFFGAQPFHAVTVLQEDKVIKFTIGNTSGQLSFVKKTSDIREITNETQALELLGSLELRHSRLPQILSFSMTQDMGAFYTSFMPGETIYKILRLNPDRASEALYKLGNALGELHSKRREQFPFPTSEVEKNIQDLIRSYKTASNMAKELRRTLPHSQSEIEHQVTLFRKNPGFASDVHGDPHLRNFLYNPELGQLSIIDPGYIKSRLGSIPTTNPLQYFHITRNCILSLIECINIPLSEKDLLLQSFRRGYEVTFEGGIPLESDQFFALKSLYSEAGTLAGVAKIFPNVVHK